MLRKLFVSAVCSWVAHLGIWALLVTNGAFEISLKRLREKYETKTSGYLVLDGIEVHFIDEGAGPVVVLCHATLHSSRAWDGVADALVGAGFRVVRFDFSPAGLTGLDPRQRYSMEYNEDLITQLTERLGVEKFYLVGTSSGGAVAFRYAAKNREKVSRLVLINPAGMPRTPTNNPNRMFGNPFDRWMQKYHTSKRYWENQLSFQMTKIYPPQPYIEMMYDMNRCAARRGPTFDFLYSFKTGEPAEVLEKIEAPTAILWGMKNTIVNHLEAEVFQHWMTSAPSVIKKYPDLGHHPYIEEPEVVAMDIAAFLKGHWDDDLRVTKRVPVGR